MLQENAKLQYDRATCAKAFVFRKQECCQACCNAYHTQFYIAVD